VNDGRLDVLRCPPPDRAGDFIARGSRAERTKRGVAVVCVVGVDPHPAVGGWVVAGDRVPDRRELPPVGPDIALAAKRRGDVLPVDFEGAGRLPRAHREVLRDGRRRGRHDSGGKDFDRVDRREAAGLTEDLTGRHRLRRMPERLPEGAERRSDRVALDFEVHDPRLARSPR
jgi:hypothetical protein